MKKSILFLCFVFFFSATLFAGENDPFAPNATVFEEWILKEAPNDAVMASSEKVTTVSLWSQSVFSGKKAYSDASRFANTLPMKVDFPLSFVYDGRHSSTFLDQWKYSHEKTDDAVSGETKNHYVWTDPKTLLEVRITARTFDSYPGVDWVLHFTNNGKTDSPILSDVKPLDLSLVGDFQAIVHSLRGDTCDENAWLTTRTTVQEGIPLHYVPFDGRSSNHAFPFWNLELEKNRGVFLAVGWSGQWNARFTQVSKDILCVSAGMERIATVLHPGESFRSPRILLMPWDGDRMESHVRFRRLLMYHYAPKGLNGLPIRLPFAGQCFDRYYRTRDDWGTIGTQLDFANIIREAGCDTYWLDAAWFPGGFPDGIGNWYPNEKGFPQGLKPLGDFAKENGMGFVLWFEPERVGFRSKIGTDHPEYVLKVSLEENPEGGACGLFKLNDPEARNFLTNLLSDRISEFGVTIYRNDFNIPPLPYWKAHDEPNRIGMTEIRYVENHYRMWDDLRERHPGLWIDNCASGGRRIDLETIQRGATLWRSDTGCWPEHPEWDQNQSAGLALYLPLTAQSTWESVPYVFRSTMTMGGIAQFNYLDDGFDLERAKAALLEAKVHQKFWYGDFYPLTDTVTGKRDLTVFQLHRSDLNAGLVYMFRRDDSPYSVFEANLRGIDPEAKYVLRYMPGYTVARTEEITGAELSKLLIHVPEKRSCLVIRYAAIAR